jgi:signal transduction histidine kinase
MPRFFPLLRQVYFFKDLSDEDIERIEPCCHDEHFEPGQIVFVEGASAEKFYIVVQGLVEVWKDYYEPYRDLLAAHGPGHLFGEMSLIDDLPRSATVVARESTHALFLYRDDFHRIIVENSSIALCIMAYVSHMVRKSNDTFVEGLRRQNHELQEANRELKETQRELIRAERLSTLGKFSSLVLHDIRNPISVLRGYAELILMHLEDPARAEKSARAIIREAERINRLASELLDYSRGEIRLNMSVVDLEAFLSRVSGSLKDRCAARGITVQRRVNFRGPVLLDEDRMVRVFMNLTDNACKAMPAGGVLRLSSENTGRTLVFTVADTGVGMSSDVLERVFEPFYSSSGGGGTGLGMLIVKNVVEAHEGGLNIESTQGKGTTVRISLPLRG